MVVIVAAVIFFANPVSAQNAAGTAIALGGVFAYGQVSWTARHTLNGHFYSPQGAARAQRAPTHQMKSRISKIMFPESLHKALAPYQLAV